MPKKPTPKMRPDVAQTAFRTMLEATGQAKKTKPPTKPKSPKKVSRGSKGIKKRA